MSFHFIMVLFDFLPFWTYTESFASNLPLLLFASTFRSMINKNALMLKPQWNSSPSEPFLMFYHLLDNWEETWSLCEQPFHWGIESPFHRSFNIKSYSVALDEVLRSNLWYFWLSEISIRKWPTRVCMCFFVDLFEPKPLTILV